MSNAFLAISAAAVVAITGILAVRRPECGSECGHVEATVAATTAPLYRLGLDIGGTKFLLLALDESGKEVVRHRVPTGEAFTPSIAEKAIATFAKLLQDYHGSELDWSRISAGLSIPGLVEDGKVIMAPDIHPIIGWVPADGAILSKVSKLYIANDIECALHDAQYESPGVKNMVVLVLGTGLGAAYLVDGKLMTGKSGYAGEFGLAAMPEPHGTLDAMVGGKGMIRSVGLDHLDTETFVRRLSEGDEEVVEAINSRARNLGRYAISTSLHTFNPERVYLAGGMLKWPGFFDTAVAAAKEVAIPAIFADADIVMSSHNDLPAVGAARGGEKLFLGLM